MGSCAHPESFSEGATLTFFFCFFFFLFLVDERIQIPLKAGHHRPASVTPLRTNDDPTINAGLVALRLFRGSGPVLLRNPIFL